MTTVRVIGTAKLKAELRALGVRAVRATGPALMAGGHVVRDAAARRAPYRTGNLRRSITVSEPMVDGRTVWVEIGTNLVYARIQEFGGVIVPKTAKALSWVPDGGGRVFAQKVTIPARPYLRPGFDESQGRAVAAIAGVLRASLINRVGVR